MSASRDSVVEAPSASPPEFVVIVVVGATSGTEADAGGKTGGFSAMIRECKESSRGTPAIEK